MKIDSLPSAYAAPSKVIIATNTLNDVQAIISIYNNVPILIGDGEEIPRIWISAPANREGTKWIPIVRDNLAIDNNFHVEITRNNEVKICTKEDVFLECKKNSQGDIIVSLLDLRPIGINFVAKGDSIEFMGNSFSRNTFSNTKAMFGVGNNEHTARAVPTR